MDVRIGFTKTVKAFLNQHLIYWKRIGFVVLVRVEVLKTSITGTLFLQESMYLWYSVEANACRLYELMQS